MNKIILISLMLANMAFAKDVEVVDGVTYNCDPKYHNKNFTDQDLSKTTIAPGTVIFGSCFARETPDTHVFKDDMTGVIIVASNLDNVFIPPGNTVIQSSTRKFKIQNDLEAWKIDSEGKPTEPINKELYVDKGVSFDPKDIPTEKQTSATPKK